MPKSVRDIVVIGASAGGVSALQQLMGSLPPGFPAAVFVVLHVWPETKSLLASILQRSARVSVLEATHEARFERGKVYVAPSDNHLFVDRERMLVLRGPRENRTRPAINPLFRSAALAHRERVVGVILTGMLDDGAAGLWAVKRAGGIAIVQSDAEFPDMPAAARENVDVDFVLPLAEIGPRLVELVSESVAHAPNGEVPEVVNLSDQGAKMNEGKIELDRVGKRSTFACPDCSGTLWELNEGQLQYRCHVGHAFSPQALQAAQDGNIEQALWTALRALKESAMLDERLARRSEEHELDQAAGAHRRNAEDKLAQAERLQSFLSVLRARA